MRTFSFICTAVLFLLLGLALLFYALGMLHVSFGLSQSQTRSITTPQVAQAARTEQFSDARAAANPLLLSDGQINIEAAFVTRGDGSVYGCDNYEPVRQAIAQQFNVLQTRYSKYGDFTVSPITTFLDLADQYHYMRPPDDEDATLQLDAAAERLNSYIVKLDRLEGKVPAQQP